MGRGLLAAGLLALAVGCGGDDEPVADAGPEPPPPTGTISLSWSITEGGAASDCATAGAQFVVLEIIRQGEGAGISEPITCTAGEGTTRRLETGTYDISIDLVNSSAMSLLDAPLAETVEVTENGDTQLGEIVFDL